mgnify:CR=1 FL=1
MDKQQKLHLLSAALLELSANKAFKEDFLPWIVSLAQESLNSITLERDPFNLQVAKAKYDFASSIESEIRRVIDSSDAIASFKNKPPNIP